MEKNQMTTGKVRFSYVHVFAPYSIKGSPEKYQVRIIIDKDDEATLGRMKAAIAAAKEMGKASKWGGKVPAKLDLPLRDGDETDDPTVKGKYYMNVKNDRQPSVVDAYKNEILDPNEVYSGCYGRVNITFFPFAAAGNNGIGASLGPVQKLADGERLSGGSVSVSDAFSDDVANELDDLLS